MTHEELEYKEEVLRDYFKRELTRINVDGDNDMCLVKRVKTYGALWHYTHQLLMAEEHDSEQQVRSNTTTAETMNIQATGLKMAGGK